MNRMGRSIGRSVEPLMLAVACAGLLIPPSAVAASPPNLRVTPRPIAAHHAIRATARPAAPDSRARLVADALMAGTEYMRARAADRRAAARAARPARLTPAQQRSLDRLREGAIGPVEVAMDAAKRTPRMIRGAALERAARARAGRDRATDTARSFLRKHQALLRLDEPDRELVLERRVRDRLGRTQLRFGQRHAGLRVWPAERIVHLDPLGDVEAVDGSNVATPSGVASAPAIASPAAIAAARAHVGADASVEIGPPELLYYTGAGNGATLAWRAFVPAAVAEQWWVIVDASSGGVIAAWNSAQDADVTGSGTDGLGAGQTIHVWQEGPGEFYLVDTSKFMFNAGQSNPPDPDTTVGGIAVLDARNQPPTDDPRSFPTLIGITSATGASPWTPQGFGGANVGDGVSALANLSRTYDYFRNVHTRNSLDGNGGSLLAVVRLGQNFANAFFLAENNIMAFGDANEYASSLDVVAHELAHGVTHHSANLIYQNESGALNEAFSDIFGEMTEAHATGTNDWLLGTQLTGGAIRNMQNPTAFGDPATYPTRLITSSDSGGVHSNSGILNRCFYLLVEGLPGGGIGRAKAEAIFYRALTAHLTASSQFVDARLAAVQSAQELVGTLGISNTDVQKVRDAFDAVQVPDGAGTEPPDPFPGTAGQDNTVFVYFDPNVGQSGSFFIGREEFGLQDPAGGVPLSRFDVKPARPAVRGDGSEAIFVDSVDAPCFILTDGSVEELCFDQLAGTIQSVSVSPDGNFYGFVLLDPLADPPQPDNQIHVFDARDPENVQLTSIEVEAPAIDAGTIGAILFADAMEFSADNRTVIFDALTRVAFTGSGAGSEAVDVWAIYAVDLTTLNIFTIVPPVEGFDVGYPALAQTSDHHLVFDAVDQATGDGEVYATNLDTGDLALVASLDGTPSFPAFGVPGYNGDDSLVVFSFPDELSAIGTSLAAQAMSADRVTPTAAQPLLWLEDADFGVVYRRGAFVPEPGAAALAAAAFAGLAARWRRRRA